MWEYAVLPVLVSARLLVSLLGDFDLFASASAQILPGGVTAQCFGMTCRTAVGHLHTAGETCGCYMSSSGLAPLHMVDYSSPFTCK